MGIISRFKNIMSANINALLDKAEDPAKMIDQYLRDLEEDLGEVKAETAAVIAEEKRAQRQLDALKEESSKLMVYAEKAVLQNDDADAKQFLLEKKRVDERIVDAEKLYELAAENSAKMRSMHDKLVSDIAVLDQRRGTVKAKVAAAKTQDKINKISSNIQGVSDKMGQFEKMEAKADKMLDEAEAMSELNNTTSTVDELKAKYDTVDAVDIDAELAALKGKLGK